MTVECARLVEPGGRAERGAEAEAERGRITRRELRLRPGAAAGGAVHGDLDVLPPRRAAHDDPHARIERVERDGDGRVGLDVGGPGGKEDVEQHGRRMPARLLDRAERRERGLLLAGERGLEDVGPARQRGRRERVARRPLQVEHLVGVQRRDPGGLRGELAPAHDPRDEREAVDGRAAGARVGGRLEAGPGPRRAPLA